MATHAAFLRGVNLGARRRVSNAELERMFTSLGLADVKPFRTSGNVAFTAEGEPVDRLTSRIEEALRAAGARVRRSHVPAHGGGVTGDPCLRAVRRSACPGW